MEVIFMQKTILGLALCLLLSGCGGPPAEERTEGPLVQTIELEENWRTAYVEFLENLCEEEKAVLNIGRPDYDPNDYPAQAGNLSKEYFLYDLDRDGVPELVIRSNHYRSDIRFLTVRDGAAAEIGRLDGRYMAFYTSPDQPGIIVRETPKGPVFVFRVWIEDGELCRGEYLYETDLGVRCVDDAFRMEDVVPGAEYIRGCRTMAEWPEHTPLTLPIYDYGRETAAAELDPERDGAARAAILAALEEGAAFCAVSGDGCGGDAGWTTLADYLRAGGISEYAEKPLISRRRAWVDLDGDGRRECVLYVEHDAGDYIQSGYFVVLSQQEGAVYAYCLNYTGGSELNTDGVFYDPWYLEEGIDGGAWRVSFREEQCCQYTAAYDEAVPMVEWESVN